MDGSPKSPKRRDDSDVSDVESNASGKSAKSGASSLLSRRSPTRSGLSITSGKTPDGKSSEDLKTYKDLLLQKGFQISGILGRGQNSGFVVHSATKNGETFAVKVSTESEEEGTNGDALRREYATLTRLSHPNIVKVFNIWQGEVEQGIKGSAMVLEYCEGHTLNRYLPFSGPQLPRHIADMAWRRSCFNQIAMAVAYLHENGVAHRDLHCKNVMIQFAPADGGYGGSSVSSGDVLAEPASPAVNVKVVDFGCASSLDSVSQGMEEDVNVNILPIGSTTPCDIFALGLLGIALMTGKEASSWSVVPPDGSSTTLRLPRCGLKDFLLAKPFEDYLRALLEVDFDKRLKAREAVDQLPEATQWLIPKKFSL